MTTFRSSSGRRPSGRIGRESLPALPVSTGAVVLGPKFQLQRVRLVTIGGGRGLLAGVLDGLLGDADQDGAGPGGQGGEGLVLTGAGGVDALAVLAQQHHQVDAVDAIDAAV